MNTGISERVLNEIVNLAKQNGIKKVILFGSRARGTFHKTSDIDVAVTGGNITNYIFDLDEKTYTLLKYDIVNLDMSVQPELLESIKKEGIVLYEKI